MNVPPAHCKYIYNFGRTLYPTHCQLIVNTSTTHKQLITQSAVTSLQLKLDANCTVHHWIRLLMEDSVKETARAGRTGLLFYCPPTSGWLPKLVGQAYVEITLSFYIFIRKPTFSITIQKARFLSISVFRRGKVNVWSIPQAAVKLTVFTIIALCELHLAFLPAI
jgi:hypothetical protein